MVDNNALTQSAELALAIDRIQSHLYEMEWNSLVLRLRSLEAEFLARLDSNSSYYLETKRRIAEAVLQFALLKKRPLPECQCFFKELSELGFSDLALEAESTILYARLCARMGYRQEAVRALNMLIQSNQNESLPRRQRSVGLAREVLDSILEV